MDMLQRDIHSLRRKIPLSDIRARTLKEHEQLGLIRAHTDEYYDAMTREQIINGLKQLGERSKVSEAAERNDIKEYLKGIERTRHPMIWADNSTLLNHGHLLMTVNVLCDFYTNKEMEEQGKGNIDVQCRTATSLHPGTVWLIRS